MGRTVTRTGLVECDERAQLDVIDKERCWSPSRTSLDPSVHPSVLVLLLQLWPSGHLLEPLTTKDVRSMCRRMSMQAEKPPVESDSIPAFIDEIAEDPEYLSIIGPFWEKPGTQIAKAMEWAETHSKSNPYAMVFEGWMRGVLRMGDIDAATPTEFRASLSQGFRLAQRACCVGCYDGVALVFWCYFFGSGVPADESRIVYWFLLPFVKANASKLSSMGRLLMSECSSDWKTRERS